MEDADGAWTTFAEISLNARIRDVVAYFGGVGITPSRAPCRAQDASRAAIAASSSGSIEEKGALAFTFETRAQFAGASTIGREETASGLELGCRSLPTVAPLTRRVLKPAALASNAQAGVACGTEKIAAAARTGGGFAAAAYPSVMGNPDETELSTSPLISRSQRSQRNASPLSMMASPPHSSQTERVLRAIVMRAPRYATFVLCNLECLSEGNTNSGRTFRGGIQYIPIAKRRVPVSQCSYASAEP
jgi:hypothetical protein